MNTIKKLRKIIIILMFVVMVIMATKVNAAVGDKFTVTDSSNTIQKGHFNPDYVDSGHPSWIFYCIHHGSKYEANLPEGYTEGMESTDTWCNTCVPVKPDAPKYGTAEWAKDTVKSMEYTSVGPVNDREYQDVAYVMAEAYENGTLRELATQYSIWDTMLNVGKREPDNKGNYGLEAEEYLNFYKSIHNGTTDLYSSLVKDQTIINNVKVRVDQTSKTYTVGPFQVTYPVGEFKSESSSESSSKKWSYIKNIYLLDQSNSTIGDVEKNTIHIVDENGNELRDSINNNNFPDNGVEFYVKFVATSEDLHNIKLRVDFEYLESCSASLEKFYGELEFWVWQIAATDKQCPFKDFEHHKGKDSTIYTWRLAKTVGATPQELVALKTDTTVAGGKACAEKNYKKTSLILAPGGVDLTMKLSGKVFLDKNTGKVNTGNNVMDSGEALSGVRVTLYDTSNNVVTISNTTVPYHQHTDSCYTTLQHLHTGDPQTGGGCYSKRTNHVHSGSWSLEDVYDSDGNLLYAKGGPGTCYDQPINHEHTGSPNLEDHKVEGTHTHSGSATLGTGCYKIPVAHQHTSSCYSASTHVHNRFCYYETTGACGAIGTWTLTVGSHGAEKNSTCGHIVENSDYLSIPGTQGSVCNMGHHTYCPVIVPKKILTCKKSTESTLTCTKTIDGYTLGCGKKEGETVTEYKGSGCYTVPVYKNGKLDHFDLGCGYTDNGTGKLVAWGLGCTEPLYEIDEATCSRQPTKVLTCGLSNTTTDAVTKTSANPVITDSNGHYEFVGLNSMKKYYVKFEYNGMVYTNVALGNLDTNADNVSKADETSRYNRRQPFNAKFSEIGSFPANYGNGKRAYFQEDVVDAIKSVLRTGSYNADKGKEQFAKDCIIEAYSVKNYPLIDKFIIDTVGTTDYPPIYSGKYNQLHVNLGIKERPTFDMALYKDVLKADVTINGKTETYNYDARKQSSGFKFGISEAEYLNGARAAYQNSQIWTNPQRTWGLETEEYSLDVRREEVANGQSSNYNKTYTQYQVNNNYDLEEKDRLKVYITYKLTVRNQSSVPGAVTELVDYFDPNYVVVESYVGDANGNKTGNVTVSETSKYPANTQYKSTKGAYKTVYLTPTKAVLGNGSEQYIYVKLELKTNSKDAGTILSEKLLNGQTLGTLNLAEINGYITTEGLIDIDSNPGNLNISNISALTQPNLANYPNIREMYEDDSSRAPALIYKVTDARTIEGAVFEDATGKDDTIYTGQVREGDGLITAQDTARIKGVKVDLVEVKEGNEIVRATTYTDGGGWYGFVGFIPGDYKIKYTYGQEKQTAMTTNSLILQGENAKSYNGQDYQSTKFTAKSGGYWYKTDTDSKIARSDAQDTQGSIDRVRNYSRTTGNVAIANHKAEVFSSYVNPQPLNVTPNINASLANELMQNTYREAYTPTMEIEVEYATRQVTGNQKYAHAIKGVDFGVVERAKSELTIDQDIKNIKVTLADGSVLIDTQNGLNNVDNLQWIEGNKWIQDIKGKALTEALNEWKHLDVYDKQEMVNIIIDDELLNGAQVEITYKLTVTNSGEKDEKGVDATTRAKGIINYVANNLTFDMADNNGLWTVVNKNDIQNTSRKTLVNNSVVDLSTQSVILKATDSNPLTKALKPGEQRSAELVLKKVLSAENASDDLRYTNMTEIVEIDNELGRYDHGAIPGNQRLDTNPKEHDTSGASKEVPNFELEAFDGIIVITPPTGSNYTIYIYAIVGTVVAVILAGGIFLIKKFVLGKK